MTTSDDFSKEFDQVKKEQNLKYPILSLLSVNKDVVQSLAEQTTISEETFSISPSSVKSIKIVLLGEGAVGKTSLRLKFMGKTTGDSYIATLGADFSIKRLSNATLQIWDIAGQHRFRDIISRFFLGAHGAIVVFDVTRPETFDQLSYWIDHLWTITGPIPFVLLGNKIDLYKSYRKRTARYLNNLTRTITRKTWKEYGFKVKGFFTSAITGVNVENAFHWLAQAIVTKKQGLNKN